MTFLEYLGELIPIDIMTPEMQGVVAAALVVVSFRLVTGAVVSWIEGLFK